MGSSSPLIGPTRRIRFLATDRRMRPRVGLGNSGHAWCSVLRADQANKWLAALGNNDVFTPGRTLEQFRQPRPGLMHADKYRIGLLRHGPDGHYASARTCVSP